VAPDSHAGCHPTQRTSLPYPVQPAAEKTVKPPPPHTTSSHQAVHMAMTTFQCQATTFAQASRLSLSIQGRCPTLPRLHAQPPTLLTKYPAGDAEKHRLLGAPPWPNQISSIRTSNCLYTSTPARGGRPANAVYRTGFRRWRPPSSAGWEGGWAEGAC
jgi:hypothetical protein